MKYRASTVWLPASLMWGWAFLLHPPAQSLLPPSLVLTDWNESCSPGWGINKVFMILFLCVSRKWLSFEVMLFTTKMFIGLIPGGRISPQQGSVSKQCGSSKLQLCLHWHCCSLFLSSTFHEQWAVLFNFLSVTVAHRQCSHLFSKEKTSLCCAVDSRCSFQSSSLSRCWFTPAKLTLLFRAVFLTSGLNFVNSWDFPSLKDSDLEKGGTWTYWPSTGILILLWAVPHWNSLFLWILGGIWVSVFWH